MDEKGRWWPDDPALDRTAILAAGSAIEVTMPLASPELAKRAEDKVEQVNHPAHYGGDTTYETVKVLRAWLPWEQYLGFLRGNAIKYQSRLGKKGAAATDAEKAWWYSQRLTEELRRGPPDSSEGV